MQNIVYRAVLFGLALGIFALAAVLFSGFADLLAPLGSGGFWSEAPASAPHAADPHTPAALSTAQGLFGEVAHGLSWLGGVLGTAVVLAFALGLVGLGVVCLHGSVSGATRPNCAASGALPSESALVT